MFDGPKPPASVSPPLGVAPVFTVAVTQWLILRRHVLRAGWWVAANIAGAASGFVGSVAGYVGSFVVALIISPGEVAYLAVSAGLVSATMGAAISAITGVALKQLLQRPIPEPLIPSPSAIRAD